MPRFGENGKRELNRRISRANERTLSEERSYGAMANKLADARRSLIRAQESAKKRLEVLENESREIKASLKSLDAALKALGRPNRTRSISRRASGQDEPTRETADDV